MVKIFAEKFFLEEKIYAGMSFTEKISTRKNLREIRFSEAMNLHSESQLHLRKLPKVLTTS